MRMRRLLLTLCVSLALVLAVATPVLAAFPDVEEHPYEDAINNLAVWEIVGGYSDGNFGPDDPLYRAQFAKMAVLTMDYTVTAADVSPFPDTPAIDPANPLYPGSYAAVAATNNIINGYANGDFGFYDRLTRQQLVTVTVRAAGPALAEPPADYQGVLDYSDPTHGQNLKKAEYNGLLAGIQDLATWDDTQYATRGETAELLHALFTMRLEITGPSGTERLSVVDLKAMAATQGYGGWKNSVGTITGPRLYEGVSLGDLAALVGGGNTITVVASDGYSRTLTAAEAAGEVAQYDPLTGEEIPEAGALSLILAYGEDGQALRYGDGPLRTALVGESATRVTSSKLWIKQVVRIKVTTTLEVSGPTGTRQVPWDELLAMAATEGYGGTVSSSGSVKGPMLYKGVSVNALAALVGGGSIVTLIAADGYSRTLTAAEMAGDVAQYDPATGEEIVAPAALTLILAYQEDGKPLAVGDGPLRAALVGPAATQVTSSKLWVKQVVRIEVE